MSLCVIIGTSPGITASSDVTRRLTSLTFSNSDPGGFEIASIGLSGTLARGIRPNAEVRVMVGCEIAWHGRVNAIGEDDTGQVAAYTVDCVGYGAALSDFETFQMIFVDRDITQWTEPSAALIALKIAAGYVNEPHTVMEDLSGFGPTIRERLSQTAWLSTTRSAVEAMYDAGIGNTIGSIYFNWARGSGVDNTNINWDWDALISTDDIQTTVDTTGNMRAAGPLGSTLTASANNRRYAFLRHFYNAAGGGSNNDYSLYWRLVAVYGNHGLTKHPFGGPPEGFYPADIASWLIGAANNTYQWTQIIDTDPLNYILYHSVYRTPVAPQVVINDMANLLGWHWGVWEPQGFGSTQPTFIFKARPANPTFVVRRGSLSQLSAPKLQLDQLYSSALVKYTDGAGIGGQVTVTVDNPFLSEAGLTRTLTVDGGLMGGGTTEATAYGNMLLALSQAAARGSGSAIMPGDVEAINGNRKPSSLLKAGLDRVRILDMPDAGPLDQQDSRRFDTFRVTRVESTLQGDGTLQTRVEFDGGADLMEVLTARLAPASVLAGV